MAGKEITPMEKILNNPGLQHLAKTIFWNLDCENLEVCREINQYIGQSNVLAGDICAKRSFNEKSKGLDQSHSIKQEF